MERKSEVRRNGNDLNLYCPFQSLYYFLLLCILICWCIYFSYNSLERTLKFISCIEKNLALKWERELVECVIRKGYGEYDLSSFLFEAWLDIDHLSVVCIVYQLATWMESYVSFFQPQSRLYINVNKYQESKEIENGETSTIFFLIQPDTIQKTFSVSKQGFKSLLHFTVEL